MTRLIRSLDGDGGARARRAGLVFALGTATISGFSVAVNASAVREFSDPVLFTTLKNAVAAVLLLGLAAIAVPHLGATVRGLPRRSALGLLAIGVVGGGIPFILFFTGLANASAPTAAVIHKTLFVWVAILAVILLRERLGLLTLAAIAVLAGSQLLIQPPAGVRWTGGETLIAIATGLWAIEVVVAKRVLRDVPAPVAAAARMSIGLVVLVGFLAVSGSLAGLTALTLTQWTWVAATGLLLAGYVGTWYAALRRAPATAVTAVLTLGAPITAAVQLAANGQVPVPMALAGYTGTLLAGAIIAWMLLRDGTRAPLRSPSVAGG
jgi:drug/metabolite transporter (DMT)-like permease